MKKLPWPIIIALLLALALGLLLFNQGENNNQHNGSGATSNNAGSFTPELQTETVLSGLNQPWDIVFLPDGQMLFTERGGTISALVNGEKQIIHTVEDVLDVGESGLLGMAVDPEFTNNRYMYACYSTANDIRVSRWRLAANSRSMGDQQNILTGIPVNTTTFPGRHSGCRPKFGPDGHLWVATGDAAQSTNPQNPQSLGGKILRVTRGGEPVKGNLSAPFDGRIYSYGHRNVQGLAFDFERSKQNSIVGYAVEHGPNKDDEVNRLQLGNFGWEPGTGYDETAPMTDTNAFPDAIEALWASGSPTIAPSGATIITGEQWGTYEGQLAVAVLKSQHIRLFTIASQNITETLLFENQYGRIRTLEQSASGDLYFATANGDNQDRIVKVTTTK